MSKEKYTFKSKLHLCCSDDDLRPAMQCIHFVGGFAYASNAHIVIKQALEYHTILNPEMLEGKSIHKDSYKAIMGYEIAECHEEGILCKSEDGQEVFFSYQQLSEVKVPNFESVLEKGLRMPSLKTSLIGISPGFLKKLHEAMFISDGGIRLTIKGEEEGVVRYIIVDVPEYEENQVGLIMPVMFEPSLF